MAYNQSIADRVFEAVTELAPVDVVEKKMFGGVAYMVQGNMCVGVNGDLLMVRVGADNYESVLAQPHAQEMDFTGRPMRGFVAVPPAGIATRDALDAWIQQALDYVLTLPAK